MTQKTHQDEGQAAIDTTSSSASTTQQPASNQYAAVARPYAEALFRVATARVATTHAVTAEEASAKESVDHATASKKSTLSHWSAWLKVLTQIASHEGVRDLGRNPHIKPSQIEDMIHQIAPFPRSSAAEKEAAARFLHLLATRHRIEALPGIAEQFEVLRSAYEGVADAEILTAFPLDAPALKNLLVALEHRFGRPLKPHVRVEPALIGGVCVTVGDEVFDTSVRAKLAQLHDHLVQ